MLRPRVVEPRIAEAFHPSPRFQRTTDGFLQPSLRGFAPFWKAFAKRPEESSLMRGAANQSLGTRPASACAHLQVLLDWPRSLAASLQFLPFLQRPGDVPPATSYGSARSPSTSPVCAGDCHPVQSARQAPAGDPSEDWLLPP